MSNDVTKTPTFLILCWVHVHAQPCRSCCHQLWRNNSPGPVSWWALILQPAKCATQDFPPAGLKALQLIYYLVVTWPTAGCKDTSRKVESKKTYPLQRRTKSGNISTTWMYTSPWDLIGCTNNRCWGNWPMTLWDSLNHLWKIIVIRGAKGCS